MKNTRFSRLAILALAFAIAVCAFAGVMASAEEAAPTAEIETANVAYNDMVQLAFTVSSANLPDGAVLGIMTWAQDAGEFTAATAAYSNFEASEKDGITYYKTAGIPAPEMDTPIYVAAVYKNGDAITIAETPFKYSALQYAGTRLTESDVTAKQAKLYSDLIEYGMASDGVFENTANYAFVKAVNGTICSAGAEIGGWAGKEVLLRAEAKNADDEYFIKWVDANGATVSTSRLTYVTAPESGIDTYTAIFGDKADSAYANTLNLEAVAEGKITTLPGGSITNNDKQTFYVTESLNGDKQLHIDRIATGSGYTAHYELPTSVQTTAVEYDVIFDEAVVGGTLNQTTLTLKDADGTTATFRTNFTYNETYQTVQFYIENGNGANGASVIGDHAIAIDGETAVLNTPVGSTLTMRWELDLDNIRPFDVEVVEYVTDADGNHLDAEGNVTTDEASYATKTVTYTSYTCDVLVYGNGKLLGRADLCLDNFVVKNEHYYKMATTIGEDGKPAFLLDKNCTMTGTFGLSSLNSAKCDVTLDNFTSFDLVD